MTNSEIANHNFAIRSLLDYAIPIYIQIGIGRTIVVKLPRLPLKSCFICSCHTDSSHGTYVDLKVINEEYLSCDLLLVVSIEQSKIWLVPVDSVSNSRTLSLNNKDDWLLSSIVNICDRQTVEVDREKILRLVRERNSQTGFEPEVKL